MRMIAIIKNDVIVAEIPTSVSDDDAINLDRMLRENRLLKEDEELAILES